MMNRENQDDLQHVDSSGTAPRNVWNEQRELCPRTLDYDRPWYVYARQLIVKVGLNSGQAIDIGCGLGEFMCQLREMGLEVTGLDGNPHQIRQSQQDGLKAQIADFEDNLPFGDATFDLVTCLEVIEHIARAENLLKEMARILAPGGYIVLSTPNFGCWQNRIRYLLGAGPVNEGVHLRFFTRKRLEQLITACGLEITDRASFGPITGVNFLCRRFKMKTRNWLVPTQFEGILAAHLLYAAKKL